MQSGPHVSLRLARSLLLGEPCEPRRCIVSGKKQVVVTVSEVENEEVDVLAPGR